MMTMKEKYHSDNQFKVLVDTMVAYIHQCKFTPSELREAAILASIIYEEHNVEKMFYIENDVEKALRIIRKRVDEDMNRECGRQEEKGTKDEII